MYWFLKCNVFVFIWQQQGVAEGCEVDPDPNPISVERKIPSVQMYWFLKCIVH